MSEPMFGRLIPAMVTPFDEDLNVDLDRAQELAVRLVDGGADSLAICATTGEAPTIFYPQKLELFKAVVAAVDGRCKIIANVGNYCTAESIELAQAVAPLGVDGFLTVVPYYNKPPQSGLYEHFKAIANAVELPVILYNIPGRTGINMEASTTIALANDVENIVAVKEASGKMDQIAAIAKETSDDFAIYSGDDEATLEIMGLGGVGVISTIGNIAPARMREIIDLEVAGKHEEALKANEALLPLMKHLFTTTNPILVKEALDILGFPVGGLRLPLVKATPAQREELAEVMAQVGEVK